LLDETLPAGSARVDWNGLNDAGQRAASGFYMIRMAVNGRTLTRNVRLVR
jgi:hypothetical protein